MCVSMYVCMYVVKFCSGISLGRSVNKIVLDKMVVSVSAGCHFRVIQRFCKYAWQFRSRVVASSPAIMDF
jgi:hypothetical protein